MKDPQVASCQRELKDRAEGPQAHLSPQGHHLNTDPVSKPYLTKVLGNIHRGEGTLAGQGEPGKRYQSRQSPLVAQANLANWEGIAQWVWLIEGRGRWRSRRIGMSPTTGTPHSETLEWEGVIFGKHRSRRLLPATFEIQWPRTFPHAPGRLNTVVCLPSRNAGLVEGAAGGPWPWQLQGICMKSMGIVQSAKGMKLGQGIDNDYTPPLAHPSIEKCKFRLPQDLRFGSQDWWIVQPCQTLAYMKALQYWVGEGPTANFQWTLLESEVELQQAIEPLVSLYRRGSSCSHWPSNWVEVSLLKLAEPSPPDTQCRHSCSHNCNTQACPRGSLSAAHSGDWPAATKRRDKPATPSQEVMMQQLEHKAPCLPPGFAEITRSLQGECSIWIVTSVPPEEAEESYEAWIPL